jgi:YVTN family beta-propeller protein
VAATVPVGSTPQAMSYDHYNAKLYVANTLGDDVSVIDSTNSVTATFASHWTPIALVNTKEHGRTLVANNSGSNVMVLVDSVHPGVADRVQRDVCGSGLQATVVRGVLFLAGASSHRPQAASLLDVSGRRVLDLKLGANDVSRLAPGVYFLREARAPAVRRVVVVR